MSEFSDKVFADMQARGILNADHTLTAAAIAEAERLKSPGNEVVPFEEFTLDLQQKLPPPISIALRRFRATCALDWPHISFREAEYLYPHLFLNL